MPDPITLGTVIWGAGGAIVSGVIGNRSDAVAKNNWKQFSENLKQYRPYENHEIQRALYRAYLQATLQICAQRGGDLGMPVGNWLLPKAARATLNIGQHLLKDDAPLGVEAEAERQWIDKVKDDICDKLKNPEPPKDYENAEIHEVQKEVELLMQIEETAQREKEIRAKLAPKALQELEQNHGEAPEKFTRLFNERWFDYLCACFQQQFAKDTDVARKFQNRMLAKILARDSSGSVSEITFEQMQDELKRLGGEMSERLDSLEKEISWISKEQREGFERVESLLISALPLVATINDEAARTKLLNELRPEFQRVIDELSKTILEEGEKGRATTIEQSEIVQDVVREEVGKVLIAVQANRNPSEPELLLHELPIGEGIEGREKECADLLAAMNEEGRVLCFTAPGGFGKTALLSKLVLEISDDSQRNITEPSINAFLHLDCRNGFKLFDFFSKMGRLIGRKEEFEQLINQSDVQLSVQNKLEQAFAALSAGGKKVWIALDNFETLLDDGNDISDDGVDALCSVCFAGGHRVRLLLASRHAPNVSNTDKAKFKLLSDIGKSLFDGLPLDNCVNYLRERGAARGLKGSEDEQTEFLETFATKVHRMPMALKWVVGYLNDLNGDEGIVSYTMADLLNEKKTLFADFEQEQSKDAKDYKNKGLKRLHYEQLSHQSQEAFLILHLLSRWNRPVPFAAFGHLMEETTLARTLARLTKNKLLSLRESPNLHIQTVGDASMKNYYALHPVICENDFFKKPLQKETNGEFKQNEIATAIFGLYEITAEACWQKAEAAYEQNYFAHAIALFECAELVYEYLTKEQNQTDLENNYAAMLMNKGVSLRGLGSLKEAIESYDQAIEIRERLVVTEKRTELANSLAMAYMNKGVSLDSLGRLKEAIESYDQAIEIRERLVVTEKRTELANSLAMAYMNKGNALSSLGSLKEAIESYDQAIEILERLVVTEKRTELANDLAMAYMNKGNALYSLGSLKEAIESYDQAIEIRERLVVTEKRTELANDLAAAYMNKGVALRGLGSLKEAIESYDQAIEILERLVVTEKRTELANDLAMAYMNKGVSLDSLGSLKEAIESYDQAIEILERLVVTEKRTELANSLAMAYMNKGVSLDSLGRLKEAIESYDQAIEIRERLVVTEKRTELANSLAMAYGNKALVLEKNEDWDAALACYESAIQIRTVCVKERGMYWLMPDLLQFLRYRLMTLLDLNRWQDAAQDVSRFLSLYTPFVADAEIHDGLKEKATEKFDAMIESLCKQPKENREKIYDAGGETADMVRETVEGFCNQTQEQ